MIVEKSLIEKKGGGVKNPVKLRHVTGCGTSPGNPLVDFVQQITTISPLTSYLLWPHWLFVGHSYALSFLPIRRQGNYHTICF